MGGWLRALLVCIAALCATAVSAQPTAKNHIRAELIAQSSDPRPGGLVNLAIVFSPDPGWHGYWKNPGDAGQGATFDWKLPPGLTAGAPLYPVPQKLVISGLMNHVYEQAYALIIPVRLARDIPSGTTLPLRVHAQWLACTDKICVPEQGDLAITLRAGTGSITTDMGDRFSDYWGKLPRLLDRAATFEIAGKTLRLAVPYPAGARLGTAWFFSETEGAVAYAADQRIIRNGDALIVETEAAGAPASLNGVLATGDGQGLAIRASPGAVPGLSGSEAASGQPGILVALFGAIVGGLLLNLMPCVFPIISLKALSLAKAGGDEAAAKRDALGYSAGAILSCLALGAILLLLRAAGQQVGWAFQLQSPAVLFLLLLLCAAITLNLLGWLELPSLNAGNPAQSAFWTGALAAFVATPCTGPFMAAALGAALVLPAAAALAIFAGLGFGMAIPFLVIGFSPAIRRRLPRPGAWMVRLRRLLAVPMALTGGALLWLLWRQGGDGALLWSLAGLATLAAAIFVGRRGRRFAAAAIVTGLALIVVQGWAVERAAAHHVAPIAAGAIRFSEAALSARRASGPVFLYFTADWCLTCKVNEKAAIERADVAAAFDRAGVTVMIGDWSKPDPVIARFLESRGRSGIPLYLYYPKGKDPAELPQLLTPGMLTALVS